VVLYAKLCKDLDGKLPQKFDKNSNAKTRVFRLKLFEKCKKILKDELENIDKYIGKCSDQEEREVKMKQFLLGSNLLLLNYKNRC